MNRPRFSSLRSRLLLAFIVGSLPAFLLVFYTGLHQQESSVADLEDRTLAIAGVIANEHRQRIEESLLVLQALAGSAELRQHESSDCNRLLGWTLQQSPGYSNFIVVSPSGELLCSGQPRPGTLDFTDRTWLRRIKEGERSVFEEYSIGRITGEVIITAAYPVLDDHGRLQAVVAAGLKLAWLNQIASQLTAAENATFTIIDRQGKLLAQNPPSVELVGEPFPDNRLVQTILTKERGTARLAGADGTPRVYAFTPLGGERDTGAYVSIGIPESTATGPPTRTLILNLVGIFLLTLITLGISTWLGFLAVVHPTRSLARAAARLAAGDLAARSSLLHDSGELGTLARVFDQMAESLEGSHWTAERARQEQDALLQKVKAGRTRLKTLSKKLLEAQESERHRISRELHDELGQLLTGLKLSLEVASRRGGETGQGLLASALIQVNELISRVRDMSLELRPHMLDDLGLLPSLLWLTRSFSERTGVEVQFRHAGLERRFPREIETAAYRIVQESLTNVARHAGVGAACLYVRANQRVLGILVRDRGAGFDPAISAGSEANGLAGMLERAGLAGGRCSVRSVPGAGTRVTVALPLNVKSERRKRQRHD